MKYKFSVDFESDEEINNIDSLLSGLLVNKDFKGEIIKKSLNKSSQRKVKSDIVRINKEISKELKDKKININQLLKKTIKQAEEKTLLQKNDKIVTA